MIERSKLLSVGFGYYFAKCTKGVELQTWQNSLFRILQQIMFASSSFSSPASNYVNFIAGRYNKQARCYATDRWSSSSFRVKSYNPASCFQLRVQGSFSIFTFPTSQSLNWSWIRNSFLSRLILLDHPLPPRRPVQIFMILKRSDCALLPRKVNEILSFMNEGKRFSCLLQFFVGCYSHTVEGPWWGLQ